MNRSEESGRQIVSSMHLLREIDLWHARLDYKVMWAQLAMEVASLLNGEAHAVALSLMKQIWDAEWERCRPVKGEPSMKDMCGQALSAGDRVRVNTLETIVEGFINRHGRGFVITEYGDFSPSVVTRISPPAPAEHTREGEQ